MSQKNPSPTLAFTVGTETNLNRAIKGIVTALNDNITLPITFYGQVQHRVDSDERVYPGIYQTNTKDWIDLLANDQWNGYGFIDVDDPIQYTAPDAEEAISRWRYSFIKQNIALVVYGDIQKLLFDNSDSSVDWRYTLQTVKDEIVEILSRKIPGVKGFFNLQNVYSQKVEDLFKTYTIKDQGEYVYLPKFGFRFEGELQVTEQCTYVAPPSV